MQNYGYLAILIGTFLEGGSILVTGGLDAHQGYLILPGVIVTAFCGRLMGNLRHYDRLLFILVSATGGVAGLSRLCHRRHQVATLPTDKETP